MTVRQRYNAMLGFLPINLLPTAGPRFREVCTFDPVVRDMLTYSRLLLCKAMQHGGSGWLQYDRTFHRQQSIDPSLRWKTLQPALHASTIVGNSIGSGFFCSLCRECDHSTEAVPSFICSSRLLHLRLPGSIPSSNAHLKPRTRSETARYTYVSLGIVDHAPIQGGASTVMYVLLANFVICGWLKIVQAHQRTRSISGQDWLALHSPTALPCPALVLVQ